VPKLIAHLNAHAPHVQLHLEAPRRGMLRDVAQRRFDVAIGPVDLPAEEGVTAGQWIELPWVVFARGAHPAIADWSMAAWLRHPHLRIRTDATRSGPVDQALCALGHARAPGPVLPHFMLAPPLLAQTNMLLTVPRGVLSTVAERFDLRALPCPIELAPVRLTVYESTIGALDPAQQWFRGQVEAALMTLG
jgi:DNA-binding transcriptional LysR family regulator